MLPSLSRDVNRKKGCCPSSNILETIIAPPSSLSGTHFWHQPTTSLNRLFPSLQICCLCLRDRRFASSHPSSLLASAASALAISSRRQKRSSSGGKRRKKSRRFRPWEEEEEHPAAASSIFQEEEDVILERLRLEHSRLRPCLARAESVLRRHLRHLSASPTNSSSSSSSSSNSSPNEVAGANQGCSPPVMTVTSTPKREPLREIAGNSNAERSR